MASRKASSPASWPPTRVVAELGELLGQGLTHADASGFLPAQRADRLFHGRAVAALLHAGIPRLPSRNQVGDFVVQLTNWLVQAVAQGGSRGCSVSTWPACCRPTCCRFCCCSPPISLRSGHRRCAPGAVFGMILWQAVLATLRISVYLLIGALILQAVLSWVNPYSPLAQPLAQLTRPFLRQFAGFVPPIAAIDLSPLIAILLAQVVLMFL